MSIDGTWDCVVSTPMGIMPVIMKLTTDGDNLGGSCSSGQIEQPISGKCPAPDEIAFSANVKGPLGRMNLDVRAKVKGDEISGLVKAGFFGKATFKGKKV